MNMKIKILMNLFLFRFNSNSLFRFSASSDLFLRSFSKRFLIIFENKIYKNIWIFKSYSIKFLTAICWSLSAFMIYSLSADISYSSYNLLLKNENKSTYLFLFRFNSNSLLRFSASSDLFLRAWSDWFLIIYENKINI